MKMTGVDVTFLNGGSKPLDPSDDILQGMPQYMTLTQHKLQGRDRPS
jgi:hypothetical protein